MFSSIEKYTIKLVSSLKKRISVVLVSLLLGFSFINLVKAQTITMTYETEDYSIIVREVELGGLNLTCKTENEEWSTFIPTEKIENITRVNSSAFFFSTLKTGYFVFAAEDGKILYRNISNEILYKEVSFLNSGQFMSVALINSTEYLVLNNLNTQEIELLEELGEENSVKSLAVNIENKEAQINYNNGTSEIFNFEDFGINIFSESQNEEKIINGYNLAWLLFFIGLAAIGFINKLKAH